MFLIPIVSRQSENSKGRVDVSLNITMHCLHTKQVGSYCSGRLSVATVAILCISYTTYAVFRLYQPGSWCKHSLETGAANSTNWSVSGLANPHSSIRLYVGVVSGAANRAKRYIIRKTWGSDSRLERVVFVIARPAGGASLLSSIRQEAMRYRDIILLGHVEEHYFNITYQTLEVYRSAFAYGQPLTHVMKCDDDSYIHVSRLLDLLAAHPHNRTFVGNINPVYIPHRNMGSKWYIPKEEWSADQANITWANGPGHVVTGDIASELAAGAAVQCMPGKLFKLEDIATGMWLHCLAKEQGWLLNTVSDKRFNGDGCAEGDIVSHYRNPSQMACMFAANGACCD